MKTTAIVLLMASVASAAHIWDLGAVDADFIGGGHIAHKFTTERPLPDIPEYGTEPIELSGISSPLSGYVGVTDDARIYTEDVVNTIGETTSSIVRSHRVPDSFEFIDITYTVSVDEASVSLPGRIERPLTPRDERGLVWDADPVDAALVVSQDFLTGFYVISTDDDQVAGTFEIPITPINPRDWEGPLSDGNTNTFATQYWPLAATERTTLQSPVSGAHIELYPDISWTEPWEIYNGEVGGVPVVLDYERSRAGTYVVANYEVVPEPSSWVVMVVAFVAFVWLVRQ